MPETPAPSVDFDVHGLVRIRLRGAPEHVIAQTGSTLGVPAVASSGDAMLTVEFVDRMPTEGPVRLLGLGSAAFDDAHFYQVDNGGLVRLDLTRLGEVQTVLAERTVRRIPLLIPLLSVLLVDTGNVLLHAAALEFRGTGVLITGWQKGGKTETLLPFMVEGARYIADEWTIVGGSPAVVRGASNVARLWDWHLRQLPQYWARIEARQRRRIRAWRAFDRGYGVVAPLLRRSAPRIGRRIDRLRSPGASAWQAADQIAPRSLFGDRVRSAPIRADRVIVPVVGREPEVRLTPLPGDLVARRMVHSLVYERAALWEAVEQHRFAFPDRRSDAFDALPDREERILRAALAEVPSYELRHPYPLPLSDLYDVASSIF